MERQMELRHVYDAVTSPEGAMEMFDMIAEGRPDEVKFKVDDMGKAEWAVSRIAFYEKSKSETADFVKKEIEKLQEYLENQRERYDRQINFLSSLLREFATEQLKGSNKRSFALPSGTLNFHKLQPIMKKDDAVLINYLKNTYGDKYIETRERAKWADYKRTLKVTNDGRVVNDDGELLDFITVEFPEDSFTVRVNE